MTVPAPLGRGNLVRFVPLAVALLGACIAAAAGLGLKQTADAQAAADFERSAARVAEIVVARIRQPIYGLRGAGGVYAASVSVHRREFRAYVESRDLPKEFPGVRGFGFIQRVQRSTLPAFVATEQADEAPHFLVQELAPPTHDDLYVIKYVEPAGANASAFGLDIGSEPIRREAAERAVATGQPTLTSAVTLVQDTQHTAGFLLFVPIYRRGADPITPAQRRQALVGLLFAPMVVGEVLAAIPEVAAGLVHFQLLDPAGGSTILDTIQQARPGTAGLIDAPQVGSFQDDRKLSLPGREMQLRVRSTPQFDAAHRNTSPWIVFIGGTLASALLGAALALLLKQQASLRTRAEALAEDLTVELERLARVVRHTSNAVLITDRQTRITWVNEGFTRITGYPLSEALGRTPGELLGSGKADPLVLKTLADAVTSGTGCRVQILNHAKSGSEYWSDTEVQPLLDAKGDCIAFMEIASDITEQRVAKERLEAALRDNDALLRVIHMHAIVSVADRAGRIIEANDAFCRISGYSRDELLQQTHRIVKSGVQPANFWDEVWRTIAAGNPWRGEVCNRNKQGQLYWVDTLIAPFADAEGKVERYISIRTDITASKNATRELARERQRLNNILEGTNVGTWEWNVETGEMVFNERWAQIVGYSLAELMPTTVDTWSRLTHPDDLSRASAQLERHFNGEVDVYEYEVRLQHKAGHWVWGLGRGKLFSRSADGRPRWMAGTLMDITERKQAEAALLASQALLDKTGRMAGVGGWSVDLDPQAIHWSDQTCRIHGLEPGHQPGLEEAIGYYDPDARETMAQAVQHCIDSGEGFDLELPLVTAQGRPIWVRSVGELERADGRPVRLVGTFQDITARHQLEAEVRHKSDLITSVIENLPCGLSVFNADLQLVASNAEFRRLLDFPDTLFAGSTTNFEEVIRFNAERGEYGPCDVEATVQAIVARARHRTEPHQFERVRPNGMPLEVRGGPMPGGGFVTTYTDISARHRAEADLKRASALLRGSIDALDDAYALFDPDDRMVLCNQRYRDLYPLCADLMQPGASFEAIIRAGAERGQYAEAVGRVDVWVAERMAIHRQPASLLTQRLGDGRTLRIGERRMADGHTVGYRVDITEFVHATEAAQEASRSKSQFLANMSHEIRTPMNAILGMLALLRKTELSTRQADYAVKTEGAARSLLGLLNDILDFSKVEAGKMTLDPHPFRFDQLMRDLGVILSANAGAKPLEVLFDIDPALPRHLMGDAMRLQQVLINLGGNAIKFTHAGEVVVSARMLQRSDSDVSLRVAVRDTGIGIAPENQARIFSGFTQAEASTTRRFGGTGLGLAISQRLVAMMGGELKMDSALGQGTTFHFTLTLPVVADDDAQPDERPRAAAPGRTLRALVVDDNPTAREVLQHMTEALGWTADMADSGEAALALLEAREVAGERYDAVFVDWQMPGLDGWETATRIRAGGLATDAPLVVMVTAHGREKLEARSDGDKAMLDGFLVKPVTASMLLDAVIDARQCRDQPHLSAVGRLQTPVGTPRLAGLRLLIAEDNLNNQQVARELLEGEGASVQIANNGQEAVEAVAAADPPFDVVLMDLQMPVMDGFTATVRIRQDLSETTLPIVAMTANAMASDRDACLAAGMNDHVGKPFDLDQLVALLLRVSDRASTATPPAAPTPATALPADLLQAAVAAGVDLSAALKRLGGKRAVYERMLRNSLPEFEALPSLLAQQLASGATQEAGRTLHTLKGVAATLGAAGLSAEAGAAEQALATGATPDAAAPHAAAATAALQAALPALRALLARLQAAELAATPEAATHSRLDPAALHAALVELAGLLSNFDMRATEQVSTLREHAGPHFRPELQGLEDAVGALDFEKAATLCQALLAQTQP